MIKVFALEDRDCANCAAKLENALSKVEGVENVTVNFFAQKLILEADDAVFDDVLKRVLKTTKKTLPIVEVIVS